jgi:hypothetical protein
MFRQDETQGENMRYDYKSPRLERDRDPVLSALLRQRGMVTYLARELGISRSAVAQWYAIPDWHIPAISKILDIPQYQLRGEPAPRPKAVA